MREVPSIIEFSYPCFPELGKELAPNSNVPHCAGVAGVATTDGSFFSLNDILTDNVFSLDRPPPAPHDAELFDSKQG